MNTYPFPPPQNEITWWTVLIHIFLLALGITPFVAIWWQTKREAVLRDVTLGVIVLISSPLWFFPLFRFLPETAQPFLFGYLLYYVTSCTVFVITTIVRLRRSWQASSVSVFFTSLFALGFVTMSLTPVTPSRRNISRKHGCLMNLKEARVSNTLYHDNEGHFAETAPKEKGNFPVSWRVLNEKYGVYGEKLNYDRSSPWNEGRNAKISKARNYIYSCPARLDWKNEKDQAYTSYCRVVGEGTPIDYGKKVTTKDFPNGTANVIHSIEADGQNIIWTEPRDAKLTEETLGINLPGRRPGHSPGIGSSYHYHGVNINMVDGSVRFLSQDIDKGVLKKLVMGNEIEMEFTDE